MMKRIRRGFLRADAFNKRILMTGLLFISVLFLASSLIGSPLTMELELTTAGETQMVITHAQTVRELLSEQQIPYSAYDRIEPEPDATLEAGMHVLWEPAKRVTLDYYGQLQSVWTTAETVEQFFNEQGIERRETDQVNVDVSDLIEPHLHIVIADVQERTKDEIFTVPFQVIHTDDDSLLRGQEKVIVEGKEGTGINRYLITYVNGVEQDRTLLATEILEEQQDQVVAVGTITAVSRGGYTFTPTKILENVVITAYAAGPSHTGKDPSHPQYGITRTGTTATEGRTIAVDPNVIPLGSWVYIEGIGLRRAEDTGGAVKGNWIDVYYDDDAYASSFGLKRGYRVYVIGKEKPAGG